MKRTEHLIQKAAVQECRLIARMHPDSDLIFAIPNGGARSEKTGAMLKAEGVVAGIPDLMLPVKRPPYGCLFIEVKAPGRKPSKVQCAMIERLRAAGNAVDVCDSAGAIVDTVRAYLAGRYDVAAQFQILTDHA